MEPIAIRKARSWRVENTVARTCAVVCHAFAARAIPGRAPALAAPRKHATPGAALSLVSTYLAVPTLVAIGLFVRAAARAEPPPWSDARQPNAGGRILADAVAQTPAQRALEPATVQPRKIPSVTANIADQPPVVPPAPEQVIDMASALRLAEAINPNIALGRQAIRTALARQLQARALTIPTLRAGMNYHLHNGILQTSFGRMRHVDERAFYVGGGARALAAETVAYPAVQLFTHLGDAIYEPLAARQLVSEAQSNSVAVANTILLLVATRYLELTAAEAERNAIKLSETELNEIVQLTAAYAKTGQGRPGDFNRARSSALLLHVEEQRAEEIQAVAAAELSRVLHFDPSTRLVSPVGAIGVLELVDPGYDVKQLIAIATTARPELAALGAAILRQEYQVRQERTRPLFPTLSVGYSAGTFGGQTNRLDLVPNPATANWNNFAPRTDFDVSAFWTLQNAGAGNVALTRERIAERNMAAFERTRMLNQVGQEVSRAYALVQAGKQSVAIAERRLQTAEQGFREDLTRIRGGVGRPIEVLNSMNLLVRARRGLIRAAFEYDIAQFQLFVALGQTPMGAVGEAGAVLPGVGDACLPLLPAGPQRPAADQSSDRR